MSKIPKEKSKPKMADQIMCFTATGGIPLFSRTRNNADAQAFPVMASLNGVHLFAKNKDISLISTISDSHRIVWKTYQDSITLIAFFAKTSKEIKRIIDKPHNTDTTVSDAHFIRFLDSVFHLLVLLIGLEDLCSSSNIERLKRDIRISFKIIDNMIKNDKNTHNIIMFGNITQSADLALCRESSLLQVCLNDFVSSADSTYGCLIGAGKIVCATEKWWMLTGTELSLLQEVINVQSATTTSFDIPVYLPHSSPNIPHRLLVFTLLSPGSVDGFSHSGIKVCVICGPKPSLADIETNMIESAWNSALDILQRSLSSCVVGYPIDSSLQVPDNLISFLLINRDAPHSISSVNPNNTSGISSDILVYRSSLLTNFYASVVGTTFPLPESVEVDEESLDLSQQMVDGYDCYALAHYQCHTTHKCFALRSGPHQLYAIFNADTPTFTLQDLSEKILRMLVAD